MIDLYSGIALIAAVVERARIDLGSKEDCEAVSGGHKLDYCAKEILEVVEAIERVGETTALEAVIELLDWLDG